MSYYQKFRRRARATASTLNGPLTVPMVGGFSSRFISPRGPSRPSSISLASSAVRLGRTGRRGEDAPKEIVAGPLGIYQEDKGRPFEQVGKFGSNLFNPTAYGPGQASAYHPAVRSPLQETGFWEGVVGGLGGIIGGDVGRGIGGFIGSGIDLPIEAAGNIAGLPLGIATSIPTHISEEGLRPEFQQVYQDAIDENPLNAILYYSRVAKMQWEADVEAGRQTGFFADIGPSVNPIEQLGTAVNLLLFKPQEFVSRTVAGATNSQTQTLETLESAARGTRPAETIRNPFYQELLGRLERGDFGTPGSQQARDLMVDEIVRHNATLRNPLEENAESPVFFTGQGLIDFGYSLVTDPWIIAAGIPGVVRNFAKAGWATTSAKFLQAFDEGLRPGIVDEVTQVARRLTGAASDEQALLRLNRDPQLNYQATREVAERYPEQFQQAEAAARYAERWAVRWEPALRPLINVVDRVNNPQRLWGKGPAAKAADTIYSSNVTEGAIRAYGLDNHANLVDTLAARSDDVLTRFNRGLGTYTANLARVVFRNGLVKDVRRRGGVPFATDPEDIIQQRIRGATGRDVATAVEQYNVRVMPLYLATERGGAAAALARAQVEAADRLTLIGMPRDEAVELAGKMNREQIAEVDAAYFGLATDEFVTARSAAIKSVPSTGLPPGQVNPERLTILGPRQMTMQVAQDVLEAAKRGEMDVVREALRRYDLLFENLSEGLSDADLLRLVRELLEDQIAAKALPSDLPSLNGLTPELRKWADQNAPLGYRPGFRPEELWRVTVNDDVIVGVNPWVELAGVASDVATYSRFDRAKDLLFHRVRGERILADARVRMAQYTTDRFGMTRSQSDALFARFIRKAQESGITPRGMTPEQIYETVKSHSIVDEIRDGIGVREAIEALNKSFEGNWRHVGLTQKFTGVAKTGMGGQSNWIGQMAERIYPTVRFTLNPLFQAQELVEPYILNIMRGVKPGWKASELDTKTLSLIEGLIRQSKYAPDDQIERSDVLLWGADSARQAFGPATRLGKAVRILSIGGRINVKEVKRVNFARATRRVLGQEFEEGLNRVAPDLLPTLRAHYGTKDMGEIAVRYLTEKAQWGNGGREAQRAIIAATKPAQFGRRTPVVLADVANVIEEAKGSEDTLRHVIQNGTLSEAEFRTQMDAIGADPDYVTSAYVTAAAAFTPDEFWAAYRDVFANGNATAAKRARALWQARADVLGMSEAEYLARRFADIPMGTDARGLLSASDAERKAFQFMQEYTLAKRVMPPESPTSLRDALTKFRERTQFNENEALWVLDADGNVLASDVGLRWTRDSSGMVSGASVQPSLATRQKMAGMTVVHNHPDQIPQSPNDIILAVMHDVANMVVTSPGVTFSISPGAGQDTLMDGVVAAFNLLPERVQRTLTDVGVVGPKGSGALQDIAMEINREWQSASVALAQEIKRNPAASRFFGADLDVEGVFPEQLHAAGIEHGVRTLAESFGWEFHVAHDYGLPDDLEGLERALRALADNPPPHLAQQFPYVYGSAPVERVDLATGTQVSYEVLAGRGPIWDEVLPPTEALPEGAARAITDEMDEWFRAEVLPLLPVIATDVRRAVGQWQGAYTPNIVSDVYGSKEDLAAMARIIGLAFQQEAVVTSRPLIGRNVADYSAGQAWGIEVMVSRELTGEQAEALMRTIDGASPGLAEWGASVVRLPNGRTGIRYLHFGPEGQMDERHFMAIYHQHMTDELGTALGSALDDAFEIKARAGVYDTGYFDNDWSVDKHGEGFLRGIADRGDGLDRLVASRIAPEAQERLVSAYRRHAPDALQQHWDAVRARGGTIPEFREPAAFVPAPLGDRLTAFLPGGLDRVLASGEDSFSLWEQAMLRSLNIRARDVFNANPEAMLGIWRRVWQSKERDAVLNPTDLWNALAFGELTANSPLDVTDAALALVRARPGMLQSTHGPYQRALNLSRSLPAEWHNDATALGTHFEVAEGLRLGRDALDAPHSWLSEVERYEVGDLMTEWDDLLRGALSDAEREQIAKSLNSTKRTGQLANVRAHPFPLRSLVMSGVNRSSYVTIRRPTRITITSTQWGRLMRTLRSGLFTSDSPAVQRFLTQQAWETRDQYMLRMAFLPGMGTKTSLMSAQAVGPSQSAKGALDTWMLDDITQVAIQRGDLEGVPMGTVTPLSPEIISDDIRALSNDPDYFYHGTNVLALEKIRREGLAPFSAQGAIDEDAGFVGDVLFSTTNELGHAIEHAAKSLRRDRGPGVILRMKRGPQWVKRPGFNHDWMTQDVIPASQLEYLGVDKQWHSVGGRPGLLDQLTPRYADHLRERIGKGIRGFISPEADEIDLLPGGWKTGAYRGTPDEEEMVDAAIREMRSRLHLIPDPEIRALYDSDDVLRYIGMLGNGKVTVWGGDYAVLHDYMMNVVRPFDAEELRAAGHAEVADAILAMTGGQYQWMRWERARNIFDPHVGITRGANLLPGKTVTALDRATALRRSDRPYRFDYGLALQQEDGRVLGANAILNDERRILLATQHADSRTGMHEMAHVFEADLDPSQRDVVLEAFRAATGSKRRTWNRDVSEWWADEFLNYIRGGTVPTSMRPLRSSFEYLRRQMNREYEMLRSQAESVVAEKTRNRAINTATKRVEKAQAPVRETADVLRRAERRELRARRALRSAKARTGIEVLENRHAQAVALTNQADMNLKEARGLVRARREQARAARVRADQAAGTPSAGGLTAAAHRAEERIAEAEQFVKDAQKGLERAKAAQRRIGADVRGAHRRTSVETFEAELKRARAEVESARARAQKASSQMDAATRALNDAKAMPTKVKVTAETPKISPEMDGLFQSLLTPVDRSLPKTGPGSPVDIGTNYNLQDEAVYSAAEMALSRAEENAFTLHYYKRGRNFIERSVNHPYFGLYPASYMWGKVLPEMVRFLTRTPFGIDAPMGGAALSASIYQQVLMQQNFDEEFRRDMVDRTDFFHLLALLTPSLPWEVPVNAPLWARRLAESDATYAEKVAAGDTDAPLMDAEQFGKLTQEMLTYAFGPANTLEMVGSGLDSAFTFGNESLSNAASTIQQALSPVEPVTAPTLPAPGAQNIDTQPAQGAIMPPPAPGG